MYSFHFPEEPESASGSDDVHTLEEELSQVKRDREILVSRLIKATKSKPSKKDILRRCTARCPLAIVGSEAEHTAAGIASSSKTTAVAGAGGVTLARGQRAVHRRGRQSWRKPRQKYWGVRSI
jgi:hypothetical protein